MTNTRLQITVAVLGLLGAVLAAAIALLGDRGSSVVNNCPADRGSSTTCINVVPAH